MRVSPAFNAITAPWLYNTITLGEPSGLSNPFGGGTRGIYNIPVKKAWLKTSKAEAKTQGKSKDLLYMRHIFFEAFLGLHQLPKSPLPAGSKVFMGVKSIRLRFYSTFASNNYDHMDDIIARFTNIEKLVVTGTCHNAKVPLDRLSTTCKKGVVVIGADSKLYPPFDWTSSSLQSIVYVYLASEIKSYDVRLARLVEVLLDAASKKGCLKTITLVNSLKAPSLEAAEMTLVEHFAQGLRAKRAAEETISNRKAQTSTAPSPLQYPTIEFLSMREYLRDHDWAGELTDEEVRPWLDEEKAERAAARLEKCVIEGDTPEWGM